MGPYTILVVPHTHWDREWYVPFEVLRFSLVRFMDELIAQMEEDPALHTFLLDGQVILLEDYLAIRPEQAARLRTLIQAERLIIGPWYIQPDEFLVSAESLVRNLLKGLRYGASFGPVMREGYIPDTFGHIAQLPQILRGFGIGTFYFMRGLGADLEELRAEFWWEAPDGSRVLAHYLSETYSNAAILHPDPDQMMLHHGQNTHYDSYTELRAKLAKYSSGSTLLFMNGGDHLLAQPNFSAAMHGLEDKVPDHLHNSTLAEFAHQVLATKPNLHTLQGELRFGRYHPILKDVLSTRLYLKQANAAAEALLEGRAERLATFMRVTGDDHLTAFLHHAWAELLRNHPHDSICGCSVDAVHREMLTRFAHVQEVGKAIIEDAIGTLAARVAPMVPDDQIPIVVFNPSTWTRSGMVQVAVAPYLHLPLGQRVYDWESQATAIHLDDYELVDSSEQPVAWRSVGTQLASLDGLHRRKNMQQVLIDFAATNVPPLGFQVYRLQPKAHWNLMADRSSIAEDNTIANEFLRATASSDGVLRLTDVSTGHVYSGLHVFIDEADAGDEYTFCPLPAGDHISSRGSHWQIQADPVKNTLTIQGVLRLPIGLTADRTARASVLVDCPITTTVQLVQGSRRADIHITLENLARDHRLRVQCASGFSEVTQSMAETAYGVITRPTTPEASVGWREQTSSTYAQKRFVCIESAGHGLAILNLGLPEYEVTPDGQIALTLLRAVGWLSRDDLTTRPGAAGPSFATPDAQCLGVHEYDYAIMPYQGTWATAQLFQEAEAFVVPFVAQAVQGVRQSPSNGLPFTSLLAIEPAEIVLSALKPAEDNTGIIIRVFNPLSEARTATLTLGFPILNAWYTNLNEEALPADEQTCIVTESMIHISLHPGQVRTIAVMWH